MKHKLIILTLIFTGSLNLKISSENALAKDSSTSQPFVRDSKDDESKDKHRFNRPLEKQNSGFSKAKLLVIGVLAIYAGGLVYLKRYGIYKNFLLRDLPREARTYELYYKIQRIQRGFNGYDAERRLEESIRNYTQINAIQNFEQFMDRVDRFAQGLDHFNRQQLIRDLIARHAQINAIQNIDQLIDHVNRLAEGLHGVDRQRFVLDLIDRHGQISAIQNCDQFIARVGRLAQGFDMFYRQQLIGNLIARHAQINAIQNIDQLIDHVNRLAEGLHGVDRQRFVLDLIARHGQISAIQNFDQFIARVGRLAQGFDMFYRQQLIGNLITRHAEINAIQNFEQFIARVNPNRRAAHVIELLQAMLQGNLPAPQPFGQPAARMQTDVHAAVGGDRLRRGLGLLLQRTARHGVLLSELAARQEVERQITNSILLDDAAKDDARMTLNHMCDGHAIPTAQQSFRANLPRIIAILNDDTQNWLPIAGNNAFERWANWLNGCLVDSARAYTIGRGFGPRGMSCMPGIEERMISALGAMHAEFALIFGAAQAFRVNLENAFAAAMGVDGFNDLDDEAKRAAGRATLEGVMRENSFTVAMINAEPVLLRNYIFGCLTAMFEYSEAQVNTLFEDQDLGRRRAV